MKTYVLMIAKVFPAYHPRNGEPTNFKDLILQGKKIHTIRANYELWKNRFENIEKGEACLSLRQWKDKPYRSKQVEIQKLFKPHGIGIQKIVIRDRLIHVNGWLTNASIIAKNDGLTIQDVMYWFKYYKPEPMALIHFTGFRY